MAAHAPSNKTPKIAGAVLLARERSAAVVGEREPLANSGDGELEGELEGAWVFKVGEEGARVVGGTVGLEVPKGKST